MSAHTPGPWAYASFVLYEGADPRFNIHQADGAPYTPNYSDVGQTIGGSEKWDVQEANARLMAAAPDLLAALQALVDATDNLDPQSGAPIGYQRLLDAAIAAEAMIAKATGAAP